MLRDLNETVRTATVAVLAGAMLAGSGVGSGAQQPAGEGGPPIAREGPRIPGEAVQLILIRSIMVAVDQANRTGDYSVLRMLGSPQFRQANPVEALAESFIIWREREITLTPVSVVNPRLTAEPEITEQGLLALKGYFPTRPVNVTFDLAFAPIGTGWALAGLRTNLVQDTREEGGGDSDGG